MEILTLRMPPTNASSSIPPADGIPATVVHDQEPTNTPEALKNTPAPGQAHTDTPVHTTGPVPTLSPTLEPTSTPELVQGNYPLEITDVLGRPVAIPARPARIVSISPTTTEMLYIAGVTAVARDSSSTFPP